MIVLLPTPVSPIMMTAYLFYLSNGIAYIPLWINAFSSGRLIGLLYSFILCLNLISNFIGVNFLNDFFLID
jgi:hypothetical protein